MKKVIALSQTAAGRSWLGQFSEGADRGAAAEMLNAMLLLDQEQVAAAQLDGIAAVQARYATRPFSKNRIGLYAEREFSTAEIFTNERLVGRKGKVVERSTGPKRITPVAPRRGSSRVGSEGPTANVIAQAISARPKILTNHPGPDLIRTTGVGTICIVTDFIGSGKRINDMLDLFWRSPSVRSWWRLGWLVFHVVAGCATRRGAQNVMQHRLRPNVSSGFAVPSLNDFEPSLVARWRDIISRYGGKLPTSDVEGFRGTAALVAFTYGLPNNTPAIVHSSGGGWRALYDGPVPADSRQAFHPLSEDERVQNAIERAELDLDIAIGARQATMLLVLSQLRGRWRDGAEAELAERTGLTVNEVRAALGGARFDQLVADDGHLTEAGQSAVSALRKPWRRPDIPTDNEIYYPWELRDPRVSSSNSRPSGRPKR